MFYSPVAAWVHRSSRSPAKLCPLCRVRSRASTATKTSRRSSRARRIRSGEGCLFGEGSDLCGTVTWCQQQKFRLESQAGYLSGGERILVWQRKPQANVTNIYLLGRKMFTSNSKATTANRFWHSVSITHAQWHLSYICCTQPHTDRRQQSATGQALNVKNHSQEQPSRGSCALNAGKRTT